MSSNWETKEYGIPMFGSHSSHVWYQGLFYLMKIIDKNNFLSLADVGCGSDYIQFENIKDFPIKNIIRLDGNEQLVNNNKIILANFNNRLPLGDKSVDFLISFEVVEHLWNTYNFICELNRISKCGFLISKPNTDKDGVNSFWYGKDKFFGSNVKLFDGDIRCEHVNFIPNYELYCIGKLLGLNVKLLDVDEEEIQFFHFWRKEQ